MSLLDDNENPMNGTTAAVDNSPEEEEQWPNISQWIANAMADMGVSVVFGQHGGAVVPLVNAICDHPDLHWVCARHEGNAASMCAAKAKYTGELGVVIATSGPGATNLTTGLLEGVYDRVPMLAITGMKPTQQVRKEKNGGAALLLLLPFPRLEEFSLLFLLYII